MGPQPSPPRSRSYLHTVLALFVILSLRAPSIEAQTGPRIRHDGLRCVLSGEHLILEAFVEPTDGLTTVKAYFRQICTGSSTTSRWFPRVTSTTASCPSRAPRSPAALLPRGHGLIVQLRAHRGVHARGRIERNELSRAKSDAQLPTSMAPEPSTWAPPAQGRLRRRGSCRKGLRARSPQSVVRRAEAVAC